MDNIKIKINPVKNGSNSLTKPDGYKNINTSAINKKIVAKN